MAEQVDNQNADNTNKGGVDNNSGNEGSSTPTTFTQEQFNTALGDRLARERKQNEEARKKELADAKAEWERQAQLSVEERAKEEHNKQKAELESRERDIAMRERRADIATVFAEKQLPIEFIKYVADIDKAKSDANIEELEKIWAKVVGEGVEAKLAGKTPTDTQKATGDVKFGNDNTIVKDGTAAF